MDSIVAIDNGVSPSKYRALTPRLTNPALFKRDLNICAYCGNHYTFKDLSRDHVIPVSKGGANIWTNVVTSCKSCNHWKDDRTLKQADLTLLYVPYAPTFNEVLILKNRKILADQMEFLMKGVSAHSRLHDQLKH